MARSEISSSEPWNLLQVHTCIVDEIPSNIGAFNISRGFGGTLYIDYYSYNEGTRRNNIDRSMAFTAFQLAEVEKVDFELPTTD